MINYEVRSRDLTGIVISFSQYERYQAEDWYDRYYKSLDSSDGRYGQVLVKNTWETDAEANERRMAWLQKEIDASGGRVDLDLPEPEDKRMTLKDYIDSLNKPEPNIEVLVDHFKDDKGLKEIGK